MSPEIGCPPRRTPRCWCTCTRTCASSLAQLASENDTVLAARYVVTRLATGCIDLLPGPDDPTGHPTDPSAGESAEAPARFSRCAPMPGPARADPRSGAPPGGQGGRQGARDAGARHRSVAPVEPGDTR